MKNKNGVDFNYFTVELFHVVAPGEHQRIGAVHGCWGQAARAYHAGVRLLVGSGHVQHDIKYRLLVIPEHKGELLHSLERWMDEGVEPSWTMAEVQAAHDALVAAKKACEVVAAG